MLALHLLSDFLHQYTRRNPRTWSSMILRYSSGPSPAFFLGLLSGRPRPERKGLVPPLDLTSQDDRRRHGC